MGSDVRSKPAPPTTMREHRSLEHGTATYLGLQPEAPEWAAPPVLQQAIGSPRSASPGAILALQRLAGNVAVSGQIQAKLTVGAANDRYEREADRVAEQVLSMHVPAPRAAARAGGQAIQRQEDEEEVQTKPLAATITPLVQRQEDEEEVQTKLLVQRQEDEEEVQATPVVQRQEDEEEVQAKPLVHWAARNPGESFQASADIERRLAANRGTGSPLAADARAYMEPRFGVDFSGVRVHTGAEAAQLNRALSARAFTHGQDIYMGAGAAGPGTDAGRHLLAHELTHVIQQGGKGGTIARWGPVGGGTKHSVVTNHGFATTDRQVAQWYSEEAKEYLAEHSDDMDLRLGYLIPVGLKIAGQALTRKRGKGMYLGEASAKQQANMTQGQLAEYNMKRAKQYDEMMGYGRNPSEAPNHAEAGLYKEGQDYSSINIARRDWYIDNAIKAWKSDNPNQALHILSLALHCAQDRGAHGDGLPGKGHDPRRVFPPPPGAKTGARFYDSNPGWKPGDPVQWRGAYCDNMNKNPEGWIIAFQETDVVLKKFVDGIVGLRVGLKYWGKPNLLKRMARFGTHLLTGKDVIKP